MDFDLNHVIDAARARMRNANRLLATATLVAFSTLAAGAQTYDITNLGLGGSVTNVEGISRNGLVFGHANAPSQPVHAFVATRATGTIDLGTLGGNRSYALASNASGQVVGYSETPNLADGYRAFVWSSTTGMVDLGTLGGKYYTPDAINDSGHVTGTYQSTNGDIRGFSWTPAGGMVDIGSLGGTLVWPRAISSSGQVVGLARLSGDSSYHAFSWTRDGGIIDLGALAGGTVSQATGVNASGQVVGISYLEEGHTRAFSWTQAGGMIDLGTPANFASRPHVLLDSGQIFGHSYPHYGDVFRAWTWTPSGGMVDLGTLGGEAVLASVNASLQGAGYSSVSSDPSVYWRHAISWTPAGGMVDLGTLGGKYSVANAINSAGLIVGRASVTGDTVVHAFVHDGTGLKDLNTLLANRPSGMELDDAGRLSENGAIVASSNVGMVLLTPSSPSAAAPVVGPISANDPLAIGTTLSASASFTDANAGDTHSATFTWGDGTPMQPGTVVEGNGSGTAAGSHIFAAAGIYPVTLTITDNTGRTSHVSRDVVVYDASAGFVTGSGSIQSPPGAYKPDLAASGRATFAFVSKYQKGANVPSGTTEFQFQTVNLDFQSNTYDWLVVGGARAQFKGTGSLNGTIGYQFKLTAIDGKISGGSGSDRFRIKISRYDAELEQDVVVYDNQIDSSTEGTLSEGTSIGSGNIVIHTLKN